MADDFKVQVGQDIPGFVELMSSHDTSRSFPHVTAALNNLILMYQEVWISFANGRMRVPGAPNVINARGGSKYIQSIQVESDLPFTKAVRADAKITEDIEKGRDEVDLKPGLLSGPKARQGAKGPYNIVAFRHGAPGTQSSNNPMPMNVYNFMKKAAPSMATGTKNGRQEYQWGGGAGRYPKSDQGMQSKTGTGYTWKSGKYSGMVHMQDVTSKAKNAGYITFRCVSHASDPRSWIIPAKAGIPIRQAVIDFMKPFVEEQIKKAIEEDLS